MLTLAAQVDPEWGFLAHLNAALNALALIVIVAGIVAIKQGKETLHKQLMLTATGVSTLFLCSYLLYHAKVGSVKYDGSVSTLYYAILIPHVLLAAAQVPLIVMSILAGLRGKREKHRKLVRFTAPIWLFVSVTGVVVYLLLYHG